MTSLVMCLWSLLADLFKALWVSLVSLWSKPRSKKKRESRTYVVLTGIRQLIQLSTRSKAWTDVLLVDTVH
jgi:hypothetical protein